VNPNLINQLQLNPQINENSQKYKNMKAKSKTTAKKTPLRKGLLYQPTLVGPCCGSNTKLVAWPHIISTKLIYS
jgi:hypothetical protein